ncbi:MAG: GNAT family N-acetyltransferase [Janthinobacterium lividum]
MSTATGVPPRSSDVSIREAQICDDMSAFRTLNEEWISRHFVLEQKDRDQLDQPQTILERGGHIYLTALNGKDVGCVALVPMGNGVFELSKMAVSPDMRGLGIGRLILQHAIAEARRFGATSLFLGSNTILTSAVKLYESADFQHLPPDRVPQLGYSRANVFMQLNLH